MKKFVQYILIAFLALTHIGATSQVIAQEDDSLDRVLEAGKLVVAGSGTLYPEFYYNENQELVGYMHDILKEVTEAMGIEMEVREMGVDGMFASLDNGQVDVVAEGFDITPEREERFLFSVPVTYSVGTAVVRASDNSGIESVEDFDGKKAGGAATSSYMLSAEKLGAELVVYDNASNEQYFIDLTAGRIDFIPNGYYTIQSAIAFYGDQYDIKMADTVLFNPSKGGFVFHKDAQALVERINEEIEKLRESGRLQEIAEQYYMGENPSEPFEEFNGIPFDEIPVIDYQN